MLTLPQLNRIVYALWWWLRAELLTKRAKEKLPIPNEIIADRGHLFQDIQLGALILKLPLGLGLGLMPMYVGSYQGLLAGLGSYLAIDFLFQFIELGHGEETWHHYHYGTLAVEIIGAFGLSVKAVSGMVKDPEAPVSR